VSLILDALNRSRQDANPVPGLATHHPVEQIEGEGHRYLPWVALSVALVLIAWLVMERYSAPPTPAADIGAPVAELSQNIGNAVASVTTELKARAAVSQQAPAPVAEVASPRSETPETVTLSEPGRPQNIATAAEETAKAPSRPAVEDPAVARLYQNRDMAEEPEFQEPVSRADVRPTQGQVSGAAAKKSGAARAEQPIDIDEILQKAREEVENASLDDHLVPFLSTMSQQTKDAIPTVYYQRHDYSSDSSVSSVVLNGTKVKVGGSPFSGMKVDEILPDSVVLSYQGTQFRLRALNSWINL
jgi:general secretion pathway protein B